MFLEGILTCWLIYSNLEEEIRLKPRYLTYFSIYLTNYWWNLSVIGQKLLWYCVLSMWAQKYSFRPRWRTLRSRKNFHQDMVLLDFEPNFIAWSSYLITVSIFFYFGTCLSFQHFLLFFLLEAYRYRSWEILNWHLPPCSQMKYYMSSVFFRFLITFYFFAWRW